MNSPKIVKLFGLFKSTIANLVTKAINKNSLYIEKISKSKILMIKHIQRINAPAPFLEFNFTIITMSLIIRLYAKEVLCLMAIYSIL